MKKILIIEDNQDVRENTADILEYAGYSILTAENGKIGLDKALSALPDFIICDIMMPEVDGYQVLKELDRHGATATIPFIFLSAKSERSEQRLGMNLGADDYLTKPFTEKELLEAIETRLLRHNFLKQEFSRNPDDVSRFIEGAASGIDVEDFSREYQLSAYKKKEFIYSEGDTTNFLYFIKSGVVKTFKSTEKGKELVTGLCSAGQFVGQLSLLSDNGTYIESASVIEDAELYEIPKQTFMKLIYSSREVANTFVSLISNSLADVQEQIISVAYSTVRQRAANALLTIVDKGILNHNEEGISISREDFAGLIGTATETAIRMLTQFSEENLISFDHSRRIIIENKKALENIVLFG